MYLNLTNIPINQWNKIVRNLLDSGYICDIFDESSPNNAEYKIKVNIFDYQNKCIDRFVIYDHYETYDYDDYLRRYVARLEVRDNVKSLILYKNRDDLLLDIIHQVILDFDPKVDYELFMKIKSLMKRSTLKTSMRSIIRKLELYALQYHKRVTWDEQQKEYELTELEKLVEKYYKLRSEKSKDECVADIFVKYPDLSFEDFHRIMTNCIIKKEALREEKKNHQPDKRFISFRKKDGNYV